MEVRKFVMVRRVRTIELHGLISDFHRFSVLPRCWAGAAGADVLLDDDVIWMLRMRRLVRDRRDLLLIDDHWITGCVTGCRHDGRPTNICPCSPHFGNVWSLSWSAALQWGDYRRQY